MTTRRTSAVLIALVVGVVALAPLRGATLPGDGGLDPRPVHGSVVPTDGFFGTLRIVACTRDEAGHPRLSGVLTGAATHWSWGWLSVT
jgi:hypothetical protein